MTDEGAFGESSVNIVDNEFEYFLLLSIPLQGRVLNIGIDHNKVVFPFAGKSLLNVLQVGGQVLEHNPPTLAPELDRNAIPG